jgi:hypothetical protein
VSRIARAKRPPVVKVLIALPADLLAELDTVWPQIPYPSRRAAITAAIELMLAGRAAHRQRERILEREPNPWPEHGPTHTADTTTEASSRPITADLGR